MYDDDVRSVVGPHWYDEPPYESDPEDFLMGGTNIMPPPGSQNGRLVLFFVSSLLTFKSTRNKHYKHVTMSYKHGESSPIRKK